MNQLHHVQILLCKIFVHKIVNDMICKLILTCFLGAQKNHFNETYIDLNWLRNKKIYIFCTLSELYTVNLIYNDTVYPQIIDIKLNFCCNEFKFKLNWYICNDVVKNFAVIKSVAIKSFLCIGLQLYGQRQDLIAREKTYGH